ncbi:hypothetical protein HYP07_gp007 [Vibrio phage JSF3]|nr:hypothetical protein HYP07_gp007 [Vibrio phage JSF3]APD18019.1 hypothetical protein [Vibrio phage JSF3]
MKLIKHYRDQLNFIQYTQTYLVKYSSDTGFILVLNTGNYSKWYLNQ